MSLTRAALLQAYLLTRYWHYALRYVTSCKNMILHSKTRNVSLDTFYGHKSPELLYIKPFGCRMRYYPFTERLPTFGRRLEEGLCSEHDAGGVYLVLTESGIDRTKHI